MILWLTHWIIHSLVENECSEKREQRRAPISDQAVQEFTDLFIALTRRAGFRAA